jgi:hypothetical protein
MKPTSVKKFDGKKITILVKSIKRANRIFVNGDGYFDMNKGITYPHRLLMDNRIKVGTTVTRFFSLAVVDGKIILVQFGMKIFQKIEEYIDINKNAVVDLQVVVGSVVTNIGPLDSYDYCVILENENFKQSDYPNVYNYLAEMGLYMDSFPSWTKSVVLKNEMDKHDSLRDYVYSIRKKERTEKINEILNG